MPTRIDAPVVVAAAGNLPKRIEEYAGRARTGSPAASVARMVSPAGWEEPGQRPDFEEVTLVLDGLVRVEHEGGALEVRAGQAVIAHAGEWVRYSSPGPEGAEYVAVCVPAFSPQAVHRDPDAPVRPARDAPVTLQEITGETVRDICRLRVTAAQERFVAPNAVSIAQAHFAPGVAWFRAIRAGDTAVGFVMLHDEPEKPEYFLWRFMIDARYQGLGFGRRALEQVVAHVRTRPGADVLGTSVVPGEGGPGPFYEKAGFRDTGEEEDGERILRLELA